MAKELPGGHIEMKDARSTGQISDVFGLLKRKGVKPLSIKEINAVAAEGWAGTSSDGRPVKGSAKR